MIMKFLRFNIKKRWMAYLDKLGKANEKMYGKKRLDCCDLNKEKRS